MVRPLDEPTSVATTADTVPSPRPRWIVPASAARVLVVLSLVLFASKGPS